MAEYIIRKDTLVELADIIRDKFIFTEEDVINYITNRSKFNISKLSDDLTSIGDDTFYGCTNLALTELPSGLTSIGNGAFNGCTKLTTLTFKGTPTSITSNVFINCHNLTTINVPWSQGEVANAPWGATKATINYNYVEVE